MTLYRLLNCAVLTVNRKNFYPPFFDSLIRRDPAITNDSLLARAISLEAFTAEYIGISPEKPDIAPITKSISGRVAISEYPSLPQTIFVFVKLPSFF